MQGSHQLPYQQGMTQGQDGQFELHKAVEFSDGEKEHFTTATSIVSPIPGCQSIGSVAKILDQLPK